MMRSRSLVVDLLMYGLSVAAPAVFALAAIAAYTRLLSTEEYGRFAMALALVVPFTTLMSAWVAQSSGRYYASAWSEGWLDVFERSHVRVVSFFLAVGLATAVWSWYGFARTQAATHLDLVAAAAIWFAGQASFAILLPRVAASGRSVLFAMVRTTQSALALGIPLVLLLGTARSAALILVGQGMARLALLPILLRRPRCGGIDAGSAQVPTLEPPNTVPSTLGRFTRYGGPMTLWMFAAGLLDVGDRLVIGWALGETPVAIYSANAQIVTLAIGMITTAIVTTTFPRIMVAWSQSKQAAAQRLITVATTLFTLASVALIATLAVAGPTFLGLLLNPDYAVGTDILVPIAIGASFWGLSNLGQKGLEVHERPWDMVWLAIAAASFNVVANVALVPHLGITAAAWTTAVSYFVYVFGIHWRSRRFLPWRIDLASTLVVAASGGLAVRIATWGVAWVSHDVLRGGLAAFVVITLFAGGLIAIRWDMLRTLVKDLRTTS